MGYAVGDHFDQFIRDQVKAGRYNNGSEVMREGLRLVEAREAKLMALKHDIDAARARGGSFTDQEIEAALAADTE